MRPIDWIIVILAPIVVFLIILIILWATWRVKLTPFTPTGPTGPIGPTGFTGPTGMTGPDYRSLIEQAIKNDLKIFPEIDPLSVVDITNLDCDVIVLTTNQEIVIHGSHDVISHKTNGRLNRIVGFNGELYVVDSSGKLWVLDGDIWNGSKIRTRSEDFSFTPVEEVNKQGSIIWISVTLDQKNLWVTFRPIPGQMMGGILFDEHFNMIDTSPNNMYRIYGKTIDKYVTLNPSNHTLKLTNGYIYPSVSSAVLDCNNDLHTIPLKESPPLNGFRIVCGNIYILITLLMKAPTGTVQNRLVRPMAMMRPVNNNYQIP